jgi:hypothetical protein
MERSLEEARALAEAARLREVVDRLRSLAAATAAELEAAGPRCALEPPSADDSPAES